ncbi:enoyl-CoA hydratase/isomerase family protein [Desulfatibacillum aliphaticivorans]|uniref:enoyl-CoA hydratase/isomerase family protein n=1 Tax=Desulfatibacillum aliphaticivorans TaxID=218208 RepID=UPI000403A0B2|nr:enoyl-CoA hydratase/isomerase family protein [Desulfatibacillum aliphaticivorans]
MSIASLTYDETVAVITMDNGENRQNLEFANAMNKCFKDALDNEATTAIIITSGGEKIFSAGVDLDWLGGRLQAGDTDSMKAFMYGMNEVFKNCLLAPVPVIAAINGHAFGNGAMLCCACDFRFMKSDRGFFCFPEVDVNIPFMPGMIAFCKKSIPYHKFNEWKLTGKRVAAQELEESHVIQKACADKEELLAEAMAFAKTFKKGRPIFGEHKKRLHKEIIAVMEKEDPEYIEPLNLMAS